MREVNGFEEITLRLPDGYGAYARYWPLDVPRGAVLYHHGIQSHCGWYETSPRRLVASGYAVLQPDRRGSGRNRRDRGHADCADQIIGDVREAHEELTRRTGFVRHHVVGISWGGKLAAAAYVRHPECVSTLTLVTPGLFPRVGVSKPQMARIGFAMLYEPRRLFDIPLNDAALFTTVARWQQFFRSDPLTLRQCTAGFYLASRRMDRIVARLPECSPVPIHLLLAGDERIIDNERTADFIRKLRWPGCKVTTYEAARHSLEFEQDPEPYFCDLAAFLRENSTSP